MDTSAQAIFHRWVEEAQAAYHQRAQSPARVPRVVLYAAQVLDAAASARAFRAGFSETNPLVQPFSHGGFVTMMGGFLFGDLLRSAVLSRAAPEVRNAADTAQAAANVGGFLQSSTAIAPRAHTAVPVHGVIALPNDPRGRGP